MIITKEGRKLFCCEWDKIRHGEIDFNLMRDIKICRKCLEEETQKSGDDEVLKVEIKMERLKLY